MFVLNFYHNKQQIQKNLQENILELLYVRVALCGVLTKTRTSELTMVPLQQLQIKNSMYLPSKQGEARSLQLHQQQVDPPHLEADLRPSVEKVCGVYS